MEIRNLGGVIISQALSEVGDVGSIRGVLLGRHAGSLDGVIHVAIML